MKRVMSWIVVGAAVASLLACCARKDDSESGKAAKGGPNAAVPDEHWGKERVVYAADAEQGLQKDKTRPSAQQWATAPSGESYCTFTYRGEKLVRLETFGKDGLPEPRFTHGGVRIEWKYAAHGGMLEQMVYDREGKPEEGITCRYDEAVRLVEECIVDGAREVSNRTVYTYSGDSPHPATVTTMLGNGDVLYKSTYEYSPNGAERTETLKTFDWQGKVKDTETFRQRWNADAGCWESVLE